MRKPHALQPGGTIGIVNLSSPADLELLDAGIAHLNSRGFQVAAAPHVRDTYGHMAGCDTDRAADFVSFYTNPQIDVVWCACGGSSACRLWPLLDWDALAQLPPKIVIGYSDTTSLLIPLTQKIGTVALHGPMVVGIGTRLPPALLDWQLGILQDTDAVKTVPGRAPDALVSGTAEGPLCGGCLSLVAATLGTPYQIDTAGKLLILEDVQEAPHRIERYLMQLSEAGLLEAAAGFIIGEATGADDANTLPMRHIWSDFLAPWGKPVVLGFPFGHVPDNYALPFGVRSHLDADTGTLTLLESAVV